MKTMRMLYDQTMEELDGVCEYSKCAMQYKTIDPDLSRTYLSLAKTEMEHAKTLHTMSQTKAASKYGKEPVDPMLMELWDEMENAKLDKMAEAKAYLDIAG